MRLVAIGEGFKNIDKLSDNQLLLNYSNNKRYSMKLTLKAF